MTTARNYEELPVIGWVWRRFSPDKQQKRQNLSAILFLVPPVIFLVVMGLFPVAYTAYISLTDQTIFAQEWSFIGLENYRTLTSTSLFPKSIVTGVVFAVGSTAFQVFLGLSLALVLNNSFRGSSLARTFAIFPYLVPSIAVALMWQWLLSPIYGVINLMGVEWGLLDEPIAFFNDVDTAMGALVFANSWKFASFAFIIFIARLQAIDDDMYDQAKILGASTWQQFTDITLPNLWSAILLVVFIRTIWMFNRFDIVWLLTRGGPVESTTTLPVFIYRVAFNQYEIALASAAAIVLFVALSAFAVIYFAYFKPSEEIDTRK